AAPPPQSNAARGSLAPQPPVQARPALPPEHNTPHPVQQTVLQPTGQGWTRTPAPPPHPAPPPAAASAPRAPAPPLPPPQQQKGKPNQDPKKKDDHGNG